ncbi:COP9 signalosome complex subunit 2 [Eremomyces bilateralis CBS 781.70]|uniref:COP9 signalosome complex subunit 2 n=1 Tax=Eremomyces bilateralis CBS 781.70 TaxID=1392243 RepID=A0A6G1FZ53_9PEZI|nr:COP9 signalosome complex subunit 2 [Eremomyces bilateralis CBS 781.70]KAF1811058.1 COP9 signalosome complex subunit 2 [Eremomyces bilateralis CBS 781.70]
MSDEDFMQDSGEEEYDFEYEDDDDEQGGDVGIENKYYNAKQMKVDNPEEAIDEFLGVPALEEEKGDWGFKGLKQAIKLEFKLKRYAAVRTRDGPQTRTYSDKYQAIEHYQELLTYVKSAVTRNYSEKSINNMLDFIEKAAEDKTAYECMEKFYSLTLESFQSTNNERLWLKTNIKLARLWLDRKDYLPLTSKLRELHKACQREDGSDDPSKGTYSLEVYALEILMYAETRNNKRLKALYQRALRVKSAVPHPKIMGIIRECGGKMHMSEENWNEAQSDFFESFRNYDEAGSLQRIQVLKYLLLSTMLMGSNINPFDSQETKPYRNDPRIQSMTDLVDAYQRDDMHGYEKILQTNKDDLLGDPFIAENIDSVTRDMRTKAVSKLVAPYTRFTLSFISKTLNISLSEVQDIVAVLIVENKLRGKINQPEGTVEIQSTADADRVQAMQNWTSAVEGLWNTVLNESDGFKSEESSYGGTGTRDSQGSPSNQAALKRMFGGGRGGRHGQQRGALSRGGGFGKLGIMGQGS